MKIRILILAVLAVCTRCAYGLGVHYVKNFEETSYGVFGQTWQIAEYGSDHQFFANREGVYEYDGTEWRLYTMRNQGDCRSVCPDYEGRRLLMGGINEFGYLSPGPNGELQYTCLSDSLGGVGLGNVWNIHVHDGTIYAQGDMGVLKYNECTGASKLVGSPSKLNRSAMVRGILYLATDDGLMVMIGDHIMPAYGSDALRDRRLRFVLPYGDGIIAMTTDAEAYYYDDRELRRIDLGITLPSDDVFCGAIHDRLLAIGTITNGIIVIDMSTGEIDNYNESTGLYNNTVQSLMFDGDGNLWAGMDTGAAYLLLAHPITNLLSPGKSIGAGYAVLPYGDRLYLGSNRGLYYVHYDRATNRLTERVPREVPGLSGQVWSLAEVDGDLLCMHDRGLFVIDGDRSEMIDDTGVYSLLPFESEGVARAWVGTYADIMQIEKVEGRWRVRGHLVGHNGSGSNMAMTRPDEVWVLDGMAGLARIDVNMRNLEVKKRVDYGKERFRWGNDCNVSVIGDEVVFATPEGVYRYDRATEEIVPYGELNERLMGVASYLRVGEVGKYLYAATPSEIIRVDNDDSNAPHHLIAQISRRIKPMFDGKSLCLINDSTLIYPNFTGYTVYMFTEAGKRRIDNHNYASIHKVIRPQQGGELLYRKSFSDYRPELELPYSQNSLVFDYGKPLAENKRMIHYRYRLDNEPWSPFVTTHTKEYSGLSIGAHTFYVEAHTTDGMVYSDSFAFRVQRPWYLSGWATCLYAIVVIAALLLLVRVVKQQMAKRQTQLLEAKDSELEHQREAFEREREQKDEQIHHLEHERMREELNHKSQEIVNLLLSVSSKNEALIGLKEEVQHIAAKTTTPVETRRALLALQSRIDDSLRSETALKRIEEEFDLVHNDFMKKLQARYPSLTNNELVMCAYIKMNLSTKEIAPLLNISTRGVETMRYRLRKKFNLTREDNLTEFLASNE